MCPSQFTAIAPAIAVILIDCLGAARYMTATHGALNGNRKKAII
jgi:hypothetical protein